MVTHMDTQSSETPIACTLTESQVQAQLAGWEALRPSFRKLELHDRGVVLWFEPAADAAVRAVAEREAACCSFLSLGVDHDDGAVRLEIASDAPDGVPIAHLLAKQVTGSAA
jgi:hypothetical protein